MKIICDWENCKKPGFIKLRWKKITAKNIDCFVWNISKYLIKIELF